MRIFGAGFFLAALIILYLFAVQGSIHGRDMIEHGTATPALPINTLGKNYPTDVLMFMGTLGAILLGLYFNFKSERSQVILPSRSSEGEDDAARQARLAALSAPGGGRFALASWVNAYLCITLLVAAYVGGKSDADPRLVGLFMGVAMLQVVFGLLMFVLGLVLEKGTTRLGLVLGTVLHVLAAAFAVVTIVFGN